MRSASPSPRPPARATAVKAGLLGQPGAARRGPEGRPGVQRGVRALHADGSAFPWRRKTQGASFTGLHPLSCSIPFQMCLKEGRALPVCLNSKVLGSFSSSLNAFQATLLTNDEFTGDFPKQRQFKHLCRRHVCFLSHKNILCLANGER